ncbi:MAG: DNA-formamidopyrimidine glycosylase family protein, partial [Burkholderiaceae bacterium]
MPELPEVEVTRRALAPHVEGQVIEAVVIRDRR